MIQKENNYAFIDSQNLNLSIISLGWKLDFKRFRKYLEDKYNARKAFLFIGYVKENSLLYKNLQKAGYVLVFKPTLDYKNGQAIKGNVDAELVLHTMIEFPNYDKAVIITGDGDFYCLVEYLAKQQKLSQLLIPSEFRYSALLKKINTKDVKYISFVSRLKEKLQYLSHKRKGPQQDET